MRELEGRERYGDTETDRKTRREIERERVSLYKNDIYTNTVLFCSLPLHVQHHHH